MFPLLDTLVAVYEIGQFTLAADELKVSQSTVSSRIAQLERMVGAPLFVRNAKSDVTPTEAGRLLYRAATGIDGTWRDACEQIAHMRESREPLSVAFSHTTAAVLLPVALPVMAEALSGFDCSTTRSIVSRCARTGWCWPVIRMACGWCASTAPACAITRICTSRRSAPCRLA